MTYTLVGGMKRMLIRDSSYEMRIRHLYKKIRRVQDTKAQLKAKHKARYADAIHSDDEAPYYHMYYPANSDSLPTGASDFISRHAQAHVDAAVAVAENRGHQWAAVAENRGHHWQPLGLRVEDTLQDEDGEFWNWE